MASLSILSPQEIPIMASHRQPLRDAPSAVLNSPIRVASTAILGSKRQRPTHHSQGENALFNDGQMGKRRFVETNEPGLRLHGLPPKRSTQTTITTLQRRLEAARGPPHPPQGKSKSVVDQGDGIKQWQKHYRRAFPGFVFYFDNVQDDIHRRCSAQVRSLGGVSHFTIQLSRHILIIVLAGGGILLKTNNTCCHHAFYPSGRCCCL